MSTIRARNSQPPSWNRLSRPFGNGCTSHTAQAFRNQDNYTATAAPTRGCARLHCITTLQCPRKPLVRRRTAHFTRTCLHNRRSQKSRLPHSAEKRRTGAVRGHRSKQRLWQKTKSFVIARRRGKASSRWGLTSQGSRQMPIEANLRYRSGYQSIAPDRRNAQIAAEQASATIQRRAPASDGIAVDLPKSSPLKHASALR